MDNDPADLKILIQQNLSVKQIHKLDMLILGKIIYGKTMMLKEKVFAELIEPISKWVIDPDKIDRLQKNDWAMPNWAKYKNKQRRWKKQQDYLATERLRLYRQEIMKKNRFKKEFSEREYRSPQKHKSTKTQLCKNFNGQFLAPILSPFSPQAQHQEKTRQKFHCATNLLTSDLLPWKLLLSNELVEPLKFNDLKCLRWTQLPGQPPEGAKL